MHRVYTCRKINEKLANFWNWFTARFMPAEVTRKKGCHHADMYIWIWLWEVIFSVKLQLMHLQTFAWKNFLGLKRFQPMTSVMWGQIAPSHWTLKSFMVERLTVSFNNPMLMLTVWMRVWQKSQVSQFPNWSNWPSVPTVQIVPVSQHYQCPNCPSWPSFPTVPVSQISQLTQLSQSPNYPNVQTAPVSQLSRCPNCPSVQAYICLWTG